MADPVVNLSTKYASVLDQGFTHGSYTERYTNKNYKFTGVKTVNVYTVTTVGLSDYNRNGTGDRFGGNKEVEDTVKAYTLTNDKSFKLAIDDGNAAQQAIEKKAAKVLRAEMDEQVIPALDKDRIAAVATGAAAVSQAITATANKAYEDVLKAEAFLDEAQAPVEGRALMVTPGFYNEIKAEITTSVNADGYNTQLLGRGYVGELDGVPVIKVPTSYFPAGTKAVLYHKAALLGAKQLWNVRTKTDSEQVDGTLLLGRFIYGSFVLEAKKKCVASIVASS